jgi:hypothetical protein
MKTRSIVTVASVAATILVVISGTAIGQPTHTGKPATSTQAPATKPMHPQGMMGMAAMQGEPHHLLAMAFKDTLLTFAKALRQGTTGATTVDAVFARAVEEMTRSFARCRRPWITGDHGRQDEASMADMMTDGHAPCSHPGADRAETAVQATPDAKAIVTHHDVITECEACRRCSEDAAQEG